MPINPDAVGITSPMAERSWNSKDALLYALSVGAGTEDPTGSELQFTTENTQGVDQEVLPTYAVILGTGIPGLSEHYGTYDKSKLVHAEQSIELHCPLPVEATIRAQATIVGIYDKDTAAIIETRTSAVDAATGTPIFTSGAKVFIRGEGGWGGDRGPAGPPQAPDRSPDMQVRYATRIDQALLYRLNGDRNPLHSDPAFAARGGFNKPILHGLCTFGFTGRALLRELCGNESTRFRSMSARFSKPVMPGDELIVSIWHLGPGKAAFRTSTGNGSVVIDGGQCGFDD